MKSKSVEFSRKCIEGVIPKLKVKNRNSPKSDWTFECPNAVMYRESRGKSNFMCKRMSTGCPIYQELLINASLMSDKEYETYRRLSATG